MEQWPTTLPAPMLDFDDTTACGLADDEAPLNPLRLRTYPEREDSFKVSLTVDQMQALISFYHTTLNDGAAPFTADWFETAGYSHHFARIIAAPAFKSSGHKFIASIKVEFIADVPLAADSSVAYWLPEEEA
ncbi:hypothetical protein HTZ97_16525 [Desulfuromonas acetoxidans]|uniref:Uncharacterized protein n=1 Tax=Desulfuromonas acetoxidans (strain DSM 684 / 11070) TaxID=281689 RepID=Q1K078_DESA6|nr:hypothetical protein [Desulfuromonas acetoxidans]EAT16063.1 hypothetical protein Dace_2364 [Desulfuromonas acetoxidans DSM 684]MBF0647088.1 hypothetical protein [Desulfuromonas acetoxidans]NVD26199.1 hypothetical protein [Desulfuromonas acetoxidans]NVE18063.1 hypothetical protein [Desulfuromonas acetoxidans]